MKPIPKNGEKKKRIPKFNKSPHKLSPKQLLVEVIPLVVWVQSKMKIPNAPNNAKIRGEEYNWNSY